MQHKYAQVWSRSDNERRRFTIEAEVSHQHQEIRRLSAIRHSLARSRRIDKVHRVGKDGDESRQDRRRQTSRRRYSDKGQVTLYSQAHPGTSACMRLGCAARVPRVSTHTPFRLRESDVPWASHAFPEWLRHSSSRAASPPEGVHGLAGVWQSAGTPRRPQPSNITSSESLDCYRLGSPPRPAQVQERTMTARDSTDLDHRRRLLTNALRHRLALQGHCLRTERENRGDSHRKG